MMGRRQKLKSGDEVSCVCSRQKLCVFEKPGVAKKTKRRLNKRYRKDLKAECKKLKETQDDN